MRQMVLQLEPAEYYTFQIGAYQDAAEGQAKINELAQLGYRVCVSEGRLSGCGWVAWAKEPQVAQFRSGAQQQ